MSDTLRGSLNPTSPQVIGRLSSQESQYLLGILNVHTMEVGDGRDIELGVVDSYICWRRVGDSNWTQLVAFSEFSPVKGVDYWTNADKQDILSHIISSLSELYATRSEIDELSTIVSSAVSSVISDKYYLYKQSVASDTWQIHHNLRKMPSVVVQDSAGNIVVGEIHYIDTDNMIITFNGSFSGQAYLN